MIIDALLSLPDKDAWRMVGDCARSLIGFKAAPPAGDRLAVQTGFFLFGDPDETYEVKRIQGAVLSYGFFANTCPPGEHQRDRDCFGEAAITVEVVSRDLIKMRQRPIRRDPSGYIPAGERSCTFHKQ